MLIMIIIMSTCIRKLLYSVSLLEIFKVSIFENWINFFLLLNHLDNKITNINIFYVRRKSLNVKFFIFRYYYRYI